MLWLLLCYNFLLASVPVLSYDLDLCASPQQPHDSTYSWGINFSPMVLKPSSDLIYAIETFQEPTYAPHWKNLNIQTSYYFGFSLGADLTLHKKESVLTANWVHFLAHDSASHNVMYSTNRLTPLSNLGTADTPFKKAEALIDFDFNKMSVLYNQKFERFQNIFLQIGAGIGFAQIKQQLFHTYASNDNSTKETVLVHNAFSAVGPEISLLLMYKIHKGLNFVYNQIFNAMSGYTKTYTKFIRYAFTTTHEAPTEQSLLTPEKFGNFPAFTQKIGLNYKLLFRDHCDFTTEIGYLSAIYMNVFLTSKITSVVADAPITSISPAALGVDPGSCTVSGPYVALSINF